VLRMSDWQFRAASCDGFEVNWPIRYRDLRPHYDAAERFLGVMGIAANLDEVPDGAFIPVTLPAAGAMLSEAVRKHWPDRTVTALRRAAPWRLRPDERPCADRKAAYPPCSAGEALWVADATGRLTLRAHSRVVRIETDREGKRAEGVVYVDCKTGLLEEVAGKIVVMCASTIETTRIMLSSRSARHPDGIGNGNGMLGKYLMEHTHGVSVTGVRPGRCGETADVYIPNFSNRNGRKSKFLRGYGIQGHIKPRDENVIQCDLMCLGEVLPRGENRVTLGKRTDKWGIAVPHIAYARSANETEMAADQEIELGKIMAATGFEVTCRSGLSVPGCSIHEAGTARMGVAEELSVVNAYNQCWSARNLFVTDGAAFPSAGFQNPTLTMMALTGRACEYILEEFKRDRGRPFSSGTGARRN
jgi:choline dehydrogenase-like flavoprotein